MDITFYKNSREASRKEVALEERSNQLAQQNKLVDYVGLTLKEYFAKIDQAVSLKSPSKRIENRSVGKNEVGESVFTIKLKDQNKRTFRHRTEIDEPQEQLHLANAVVFKEKIHKNTEPCNSTRQSPSKVGVIPQSKHMFRDRHLRKSFILPSPHIFPVHSLLREELTQHLQKLKDSSNLPDVSRLDVTPSYASPFKIRELKPMVAQHKKHNKSFSEHSSQVEVRHAMLKKSRAQMMLKMSPKKKQKQLESGRHLHIIK